MATATATRNRTRKPSPSKATRSTRRTFDGSDANQWNEIPSKGMLFTLAIAAYEGKKFPGSELFGSRENAKALISEIKGR